MVSIPEVFRTSVCMRRSINCCSIFFSSFQRLALDSNWFGGALVAYSLPNVVQLKSF